MERIYKSPAIALRSRVVQGRRLLLALTILLLLLIGGMGTASAADLSHKRVLLLFSYHPTFASTERVLAGVRSVLDKHHLTLDVEFMDTKYHPGAGHLASFLQMLQQKLAERPRYDMVIAADDNAFNFTVDQHSALFPGVPVVFLGVNNKAKAMGMDHNPLVTGIVEAITVDETLRLALQLRPGTKKVYAVVDGTESGKNDLTFLRESMAHFPSLQLALLHLDDLSWPELAAKLGALGDDGIVLRLASFRDRTGEVLSIEDVMGLLVTASPVPVFGLRGHDVIHGALGGHVVSFAEQGRRAALIAEAVLDGAPMAQMQVVADSPNLYMFNYGGLTRFAIGERQLPAEAIVLNKPASIWDTYTREVWLTLAFIALLLGLITYLSLEIRRRRRAENEVRRHRDHLEEMVAERTASLSLANKEIESFSYSVSHDLRAPLRSIDGFSHMLLEEFGCKLDETGKGYLARVRGAAQQMAQLIDDLLQLSRVSRQELNREPLNLTGMCETIFEELRRDTSGRSVKSEVEPALVLQGDPRLIGIVMRNLLANAWKYTGKNPVPRVEVGVLRDDKGPVYFVRDNGVGFDARYVDKLFKPFQRLHSPGEFPGTGVGLATVARIIARHGGRVWAEAEVGKGATFFFTLEDYGAAAPTARQLPPESGELATMR